MNYAVDALIKIAYGEQFLRLPCTQIPPPQGIHILKESNHYQDLKPEIAIEATVLYVERRQRMRRYG